ncbi:CG0192-related protein [Arthrobacter sp. TMN-37]
MAILHKASLRPTKLELLATWLPAQPWWRNSSVEDLQKVCSFRFDDPDGEVGVETLLVTSDREVVQVPLTYRGSPLAGAEAGFVGVLDHSVLGKRWVYDACVDPVYRAAASAALLGGPAQAAEFLDVDGRLEPSPQSAVITVLGGPAEPRPGLPAGGAARMHTPVPGVDVDFTVFRVPDVSGLVEGPIALVGTWPGQEVPVQLLAGTRRTG